MNRLYYLYHFLIGDLFISWLHIRKKFRIIGDKCLIFKPIFLDKYAKKYVYVGDNVTIGRNARINCFPLWNLEKNNQPYISIGSNSIIQSNISLLAGGEIYIGKNVLIASHVLIASENHSIDPECNIEYMNQPLLCANVKIEDGCWIGEKVCILPGVTIGEKSVIGAGSVVTKSIPAYCIAAGNPARIIKKFDFQSHKWIKV